MKLSYVKVKETFFIFIGLSLFLLSLENILTIEFNLPYLSEHIVLFGMSNIFFTFTHPLILLLLLCVLDITIGIMIVVLAFFIAFFNAFFDEAFAIDYLFDYLFEFISDKLPISTMILTLLFSETAGIYKEVYNSLKQFVLIFISGGLLCISIFGERGLAYLSFFIYILILINYRNDENKFTEDYLLEKYLLKEVIYGLPYLIFIPHTVYLFGLYGAIFGCFSIYIISYLILREDLIVEEVERQYTLFAIAYLIIVPVSTCFGGIVGTIVSCIIIYTFYLLIDIENNKIQPQEFSQLQKIFSRVDPNAS